MKTVAKETVTKPVLPLIWRKWMIAAGILLLAILCAAAAIIYYAGPAARDHLISALQKRFDAQVELKSLDLSAFPNVSADGEGLVIRRRGQSVPFIAVRKFSANTGLLNLLWFHPHIQQVRLEGLQIHVPPKDEKPSQSSGKHGSALPFILDEIVADGTVFERLPKNPGKQPLTFYIERLRLHSAGAESAMSFQAVLKNPKPPGLIESSGKFGPWDRDQPAATPVSGAYVFRNADLSVFRGIAGILSSEGKYSGELDRIVVDGKTDTPDFSLKPAAHAMHLTATFHAVVDGTSGDTQLDPVNARLGDTSIRTQGKVAGAPEGNGKDITLDAAVTGGRLEDLLRLAVKSEKPPITGTVNLQSKIEVPHGDADVIDKLRLDGKFSVSSARFTSFNVEQKLAGLSRRARGKPEASGPGSVLSSFQGQFRLRGGIMSFSTLSFSVPGAAVRLAGTYGLRSQALNFRGTVSLAAELSETTTGFLSLLLKLVDPLFKKKNAGAVIPITIKGTRSDPAFGLDIGAIN